MRDARVLSHRAIYTWTSFSWAATCKMGTIDGQCQGRLSSTSRLRVAAHREFLGRELEGSDRPPQLGRPTAVPFSPGTLHSSLGGSSARLVFPAPL